MSADILPIRPDITNADYHKLPALSSSGARDLTNGTPAEFKWKRENETHSTTFDIGNAAHAMVLGDPTAKLEVVKVMDWRTTAAKETRDQAYRDNRIPLNLKELAMVEQMAASVKSHPLASSLLDPDHGEPEKSLFWIDDETGVELRARLDWMPEVVEGQRMVTPDFKTAVSADPKEFARSAASLGYGQQAAFYIDAIKAAGLDDDPAFVFIIVEKTPPYQVSVVMLDDEAVAIGRHLNRKAIRLFKKCTDENDWPSYGNGIHVESMPRWYSERYLSEMLG